MIVTIDPGILLNIGRRLTTYALCYHFITGLGDDTVWSNFPGGVSESQLSRGYVSDLEHFIRGEYKNY